MGVAGWAGGCQEQGEMPGWLFSVGGWIEGCGWWLCGHGAGVLWGQPGGVGAAGGH